LSSGKPDRTGLEGPGVAGAVIRRRDIAGDPGASLVGFRSSPSDESNRIDLEGLGVTGAVTRRRDVTGDSDGPLVAFRKCFSDLNWKVS
jgi:hypothetical protein